MYLEHAVMFKRTKKNNLNTSHLVVHVAKTLERSAINSANSDPCDMIAKIEISGNILPNK